jgi:hypothetical protein
MAKSITRKEFEKQINIIWRNYESSWGVSIQHTTLTELKPTGGILFELIDNSNQLRQLQKMELETVYIRLAKQHTPLYGVQIKVTARKK